MKLRLKNNELDMPDDIVASVKRGIKQSNRGETKSHADLWQSIKSGLIP